MLLTIYIIMLTSTPPWARYVVSAFEFWAKKIMKLGNNLKYLCFILIKSLFNFDYLKF
jgi:hypothetical protein